MDVFEKIKEAKAAADHIGEVLEVVGKLKVADTDHDGQSDLAEIIDHSAKLAVKIAKLRQDIEDCMVDVNEITKLAGANFEVITAALQKQGHK